MLNSIRVNNDQSQLLHQPPSYNHNSIRANNDNQADFPRDSYTPEQLQHFD
jgi:hypothetical protein